MQHEDGPSPAPVSSSLKPESLERPVMWDSAEVHDLRQQTPEDDEDEDSDSSAAVPNKRPSRGRKPKRNPRQQQQNKQAQKRYREKRKQHLEGMEQAVDELTAKLQALKQIESQHETLQRQAQELQQRLQESEQSMVSLQEELLECCPHGSCKPHPPNRPPMITDNFPHDVAQLRSFLDKHSLWQAGTQGHWVDPGLLAALTVLVERAYNSGDAGREGRRVSELILADAEACRAQADGAPSWDAILQAVQLSPEQATQMVATRRDFLASAKDLYRRRQDLNLQTMAQTLSLKGEPGSSSPCAASPGCCQGPGPKVRDWGAAARFLPPPQGRSSLPAEGQGVEGALEGLQDNIAQERRIFRRLSHCVVHDILQPVQAAMYMVMAYPQRCACLSLASFVALSQEGLPAGGAGGISGPLAAAPVQGLPGPSQQSVDVLPGSSGVLSLPLDFLQGAGGDTDMTRQGSLTAFLLDTLGPELDFSKGPSLL